MEWWNDIRMLCARYLVASEQMERSGPVAAAVRAAGYTSEDEGVEETEDEGSSVEEEAREDADEDDDAVFVEARDGAPGLEDDAGPPEYSHANAQGRAPDTAEYGANGYPVRGRSAAPARRAAA